MANFKEEGDEILMTIPISRDQLDLIGLMITVI